MEQKIAERNKDRNVSEKQNHSLIIEISRKKRPFKGFKQTEVWLNPFSTGNTAYEEAIDKHNKIKCGESNRRN